jgi:hypothetical protein
VSSFSSFRLFEAGQSQLYNACEWGQLRRSQDSLVNGKVVARRAAVASQAIIAEIAGDGLSDADFTKITRAVNRGVDKIHEDIRPFLKYFIRQAARVADLTPEDFKLSRLRYIHAGPYPEGHFNRALEWIVSWGLIDGGNEFATLVDSSKLLQNT